MKLFLLIAGYDYYPGHGTSDWKQCFTTKKEAEDKVTKANSDFGGTGWVINDIEYDWYEIIDLREWIF